MVKAKAINGDSRRAARPKIRRIDVEFVLDQTGAEEVYVCGDFNDWRPESLCMIGDPDDGLWEKKLPLHPGRYEYKFLVDGRWVHDPNAAESVTNAFGSLNSVLNVANSKSENSDEH